MRDDNRIDQTPVMRPVDRSAPPRAAPVSPFRFPDLQSTALGPHCRLLAIRSRRQPLVALQVLLGGGARREAADTCGLASFAASLLDEGTTRESAPQIAARVEGLGAALAVGAGWDSTYLSLTVLARHLRAGLELLRELLHDADFPAAEIERRRRQRLATLLRRRDQSGTLANDRLAAAIYGDRAYGLPQLGTEPTISALDRHQIVDFHRRIHHGTPADLIAVGDFDSEQLVTDAREIFAATGAHDDSTITPIRHRTLDGIEVHIVDRTAAAQTELRLGHIGLAATAPDVIPARILNSILGGKFTSRINLNLRERHGYTYGASSQFVLRRGSGPFQVATAVDTDKVGAATREVLHELDRIREERVSAAELTDSKAYVVGSFPYTVQSVEGMAARLAQIALFDLPDDHFQGLPEAVASVDASAVQRVARERLQPRNLVVVAVGPAARLRPQLEALGSLHTWTADSSPLDL